MLRYDKVFAHSRRKEKWNSIEFSRSEKYIDSIISLAWRSLMNDSAGRNKNYSGCCLCALKQKLKIF